MKGKPNGRTIEPSSCAWQTGINRSPGLNSASIAPIGSAMMTFCSSIRLTLSVSRKMREIRLEKVSHARYGTLGSIGSGTVNERVSE